MSNLGDELEDEESSILNLQRGDDWEAQYEALIAEIQRVFALAERDDHRHDGEALGGTTPLSSIDSEEGHFTALHDLQALNGSRKANSIAELQTHLSEMGASGENGMVDLAPGVYSDLGPSDQIVIPQTAGDRVGIDLTGATLEYTSWDDPADPIIHVEPQDDNSAVRHIKQGSIDATGVYGDFQIADPWSASGNNLGTAIELNDCERSVVTTEITGFFSIGVDIRNQNNSGHHKHIEPTSKYCETAIRVGDPADSASSDRGYYGGQLARVGKYGVNVVQGSQNEFHCQVENLHPADKQQVIGINFPYNDLSNEDNLVTLAHGISGTSATPRTLSIFAATSRQQIMAPTGGNWKIQDRLAVAVPPSEIDIPEYDTTVLTPQSTPISYFSDSSSNGGSVETSKFGSWKINSGTTADGRGAMENYSGNLTSSGISYWRVKNCDVTDSVVRIGNFVDDDDYIAFVGDSANTNWHIQIVNSGTVDTDVTTPVPIGGSEVDFSISQTQYSDGANQQHWFINRAPVHVSEEASSGTAKMRAELQNNSPPPSSSQNINVSRWQMASRFGFQPDFVSGVSGDPLQ